MSRSGSSAAARRLPTGLGFSNGDGGHALGSQPFDELTRASAREFYRRLGIEHLGDWLRYGADAAALRRLAAEDLPDRH
jgi:hypothetical protein